MSRHRATTPGGVRQRLTARLRAIAGRPTDDAPPAPHSRVHVASFEHTHRVWTPPDPPRRWFEAQGIEEVPPKYRWRLW